MGEVSHSEIISYPSAEGKWKEITFNSGATQSTLQEIKLPDCSGSFSYLQSNDFISPCSNRFIYWRVSGDILELVELSLDFNLIGNQLRLRFQQSPVLGGVTIHETANHVIILVATVSSIHRFCFPHPRTRKPSGHGAPSDLLSIFQDASHLTLCDPSSYYVVSSSAGAGMPLPHTFWSWLTLPEGDEGEASVFVLASTLGTLQVVAMEPDSSKITSFELQQISMISRLWSGIVPSVIRSNATGDDAVVSLVSHRFAKDDLIFALGKDLKLRTWCYQTRECLNTTSLLELCSYTNHGNISLNGQQVRKAIGSYDTHLFLAVYLNLPEKNLFCILQVVKFADTYHLNHISTISGPELDLVDFKLTLSQLWTLWLNGDSQPVVKLINLESRVNQSQAWRSAALLPPLLKEVHLSYLEPQEAYLREIFHPGRFSAHTIAKAIMSYRREVELSTSLQDRSYEALREEVITAVEAEIHSQATESELTAEEYLSLQTELWDTFYSYCVQYHEVGLKPLGLCLDPETGLAALISRNMISFLKPCDQIENIILSSSTLGEPLFFENNTLLEQDPSIKTTVQGILECLSVLRRHIPEDALALLNQEMFSLHNSPHALTADLASELLLQQTSDSTENLETELVARLATIQNVVPTCEILIHALDLGQDELIFNNNSGGIPTTLFASATGVSALCESVQHYSHNCFTFSRDLLILLHLVVRLGEKSGQPIDSQLQELIQEASAICQAYFVMWWSTLCQVAAPPVNVLESGLHQLSLLNLNDQANPSSSTKTPGTLVHLFLREQGLSLCIKYLFSSELEQEASWSSCFPLLVNIITRLLWPKSQNFIFLEFLFSHCQYLPLQEYIRLLEVAAPSAQPYSRRFLEACCHLCIGESHKALSLFTQAAEGVLIEPFLHTKLLQASPDQDHLELTGLFYLKVIKLFEYFNLPDCIIPLATHHLNSLQEGDPNFDRFHIVVFRNHLELGHINEAFDALLVNNGSSRKECLRQFVSVLCERKELEKLIQFEYIDMEQDLISILESRARSSDLLTQNFYELLFAYYIKNFNYRRAASTLYEQALRLGRELAGSESLTKQVKCYLATINCLMVGDPKYAWIVKPLPKTLSSSFMEEDQMDSSSKRNWEGEEISSFTPKVELVELEDIRKEYSLARARLSLYYLNPVPTNLALSPMAPCEVVTHLITNGLFDEAIYVSLMHKLSLVPVFEGYILKCLNLIHAPSSGDSISARTGGWDWLRHNDVTKLPLASDERMAWFLLEHYLRIHEQPGQTIYHKCVVKKLLAFRYPDLPLWLLHSYQRKNPTELLWLYIQYGYLDVATELATAYLDAVLGVGKDHFGLQTSLHSTSPPVWVPYTYIDALLVALEERMGEPESKELYERLEKKLEEYFHILESVSEKMIEQKLRSAF